MLLAGEFTVAMTLRLGAPVLSEGMLCQSCGNQMLDAQGCHGPCCSVAESTVGHYRVGEVMHPGCAVSDASVCMEALGLVDLAPDLRQADVFTWAAGV